jgi:hypothetical protein
MEMEHTTSTLHASCDTAQLCCNLALSLTRVCLTVFCLQRYVLTPDGRNCTLIVDPDGTTCNDRRRCTTDDK